MDVALMQFVAEACPAAPSKAPGKAAAASAAGSDGGSFGAMFADLVAPEQPNGGEGAKQAAENAGDVQTAADAAPGLIPGMWSFVPVAALTATAPPTAQVAETAITPPTAAWTGQQAQAQIAALPAVDPQVVQQAIATVLGQQSGRQQAAPTQQPQMPLTQAPTTNAIEGQPTVVTPAAGLAAQAAVPQAMTAEPAQPATEVPLAPTQQPTAQAATAGQTGQQQATTPAIATPAIPTPTTGDRQRAPEKQDPVTASQAAADVDPGATRPLVAAVTPNGETQGAGDDGTALTTGTSAPQLQDGAPLAEKTANQPFAAYVDQAAARQPAGDARAAAVSDQAAPNQDPHNVAGQIVDHARLISRAANSEMVIRLKPEHLGELTLKIAVDSGVVSATFHTSNAEVRAAIEASLPQLRQDMANQGLKVDNVGVYASLDHFFANDQRHAPQQQQQLTVRRPSRDEAFGDTAAAATVAGIPAATAAGGIDYRI